MKIMLSVFLFASLLAASSALAVADPTPNTMGIYFDLTADTYDFDIDIGTMPAFLILTNPDFPELYGYEFGYVIDGGLLMNIVLNGPGPIGVGCMSGDCIIGLSGPLVTTEATLIATFNVFVMGADDAVYFTLRGPGPSSVGDSRFPAVLLANDEIVAMGLSAWDDATQMPAVCAVINGAESPVATDEALWETVKAIYR